ncbi:hypothetical protein ACLOJK_034004 [Asimina triloba]
MLSSLEVGKLQCFSWIKERFNGPGVQFCVIGDGMEECEAAHTMRWPFIRIALPPNGFHRFPGLTTKMVDHYIDVIYDVSDTGNHHQNHRLEGGWGWGWGKIGNGYSGKGWQACAVAVRPEDITNEKGPFPFLSFGVCPSFGNAENTQESRGSGPSLPSPASSAALLHAYWILDS